MAQDRFCDSCKVHVNEDLTNCPLCGKHIIKQGENIEQNKNSYPIYDFGSFQKNKWFNITRGVFWIVALICVLVNLCFPTTPYWFPYVLAALVMIFHVFIAPIKVSVSSYVKELTIMSVLVAIFLIFIDAYNHLSFGTKFCWALAYSGPFVMLAGMIASSVLCYSVRKYETELLRSVAFLAGFSVVYFLVVFFAFKSLPLWPSLTFMCSSLALLASIQLFKRNKLLRELRKEFHL